MPTWLEVQTLESTIVEAIAVVKGEKEGDEFLWDHEYFEPRAGPIDPETQKPEGAYVTGGWRGRIDSLRKSGS